MGTTFRSAAEEDSKHGEMYMYAAAQAVTINVVSQSHGVLGFTAGTLDTWTYNAGKVGNGNITTAGGGAAINIADVAHGLITGDYVAVQSANHSGLAIVTKVDDDNFTVPIAYVGDEAGFWQQGDYLKAGANSGGEYDLEVSLSGETVGTLKTFMWEIAKNGTILTNIASERKHASTDVGAIPLSGVISGIVEGDVIWLTAINKTDTTNFTIEHINIKLKRI
jgi:hypothetical protein